MPARRHRRSRAQTLLQRNVSANANDLLSSPLSASSRSRAEIASARRAGSRRHEDSCIGIKARERVQALSVPRRFLVWRVRGAVTRGDGRYITHVCEDTRFADQAERAGLLRPVVHRDRVAARAGLPRRGPGAFRHCLHGRSRRDPLRPRVCMLLVLRGEKEGRVGDCESRGSSDWMAALLRFHGVLLVTDRRWAGRLRFGIDVARGDQRLSAHVLGDLAPRANAGFLLPRGDGGSQRYPAHWARSRQILLLILGSFWASYAQNTPAGWVEALTVSNWYLLDAVEHLVSVALFCLAVRECFRLRVP